MPSSESRGLDLYATNWANATLGTAFYDTLGYLSVFIFNCEWLIASGPDWGTLMGTGILGSIVLYVPVMCLLILLLSCNLLNELGKDLIYLAYRLSSAVVGAVILNMFFGMTIPLAPVIMYAAIGTAVYYLLKACGCCGSPEVVAEATAEILASGSSYNPRQFGRSSNRNSPESVIEVVEDADNPVVATAVYN